MLGAGRIHALAHGSHQVLYPTRNWHAATLAVVVVAQLLDLATFVPAVARVGIGAESNPFARTLYQSAGPLGPAALKAAAVAIMLLAPGRFSTITGCPSMSPSLRPTMRAVTSPLDPAAKPTIRRIGRAG